MLTTVTNLSASLSLNALESYTGGSGPSALNAVGGNRIRPLPYPFDWVVLAASGNRQLPMHPRDWRRNTSHFYPHEPADQWTQLVQAGAVSLAFAAETGRRDIEELFVNAV